MLHWSADSTRRGSPASNCALPRRWFHGPHARSSTCPKWNSLAPWESGCSSPWLARCRRSKASWFCISPSRWSKRYSTRLHSGKSFPCSPTLHRRWPPCVPDGRRRRRGIASTRTRFGSALLDHRGASNRPSFSCAARSTARKRSPTSAAATTSSWSSRRSSATSCAMAHRRAVICASTCRWTSTPSVSR